MIMKIKEIRRLDGFLKRKRNVEEREVILLSFTSLEVISP